MRSSAQRQVADGQVRLPRIADVVADRIRELVLEGDLADGERLPPLEGLLEQFGVSGPSMREALRVLEAEGLIEVQRGNVGGAVVHRPNARMAAYSIALVLRSEGATKGEVADALGMIEPMCGIACARRADRQSTVVRDLRAINARSRELVDGEAVAFNETMNQFHAAIVRECGSEALRVVTVALASVWRADMETWASANGWHSRYPKPAERVEVLESHEAITDLIEAGDALGVAAAMTAHMAVHRIYRDGVDPTGPVDHSAVRLRR
jgi:DNA-binding FadR family transcriptional regulator